MKGTGPAPKGAGKRKKNSAKKVEKSFKKYLTTGVNGGKIKTSKGTTNAKGERQHDKVHSLNRIE